MIHYSFVSEKRTYVIYFFQLNETLAFFCTLIHRTRIEENVNFDIEFCTVRVHKLPISVKWERETERVKKELYLTHRHSKNTTKTNKKESNNKNDILPHAQHSGESEKQPNHTVRLFTQWSTSILRNILYVRIKGNRFHFSSSLLLLWKRICSAICWLFSSGSPSHLGAFFYKWGNKNKQE